MALVVLAKFTTRAEAETAAGALRASGAPAFVFDDGPGGSAYNLPLSGEGFRLLVPAEWKARAQAALAALRAGAGEAD
jgi:hypothetical protein